MKQLNYNRMSLIGIAFIIIIIGLVFIVNYYSKFTNYDKELPYKIVDNSAERNTALNSNVNLPSNSIGKSVHNSLLWGAYVGDSPSDLSNFENLVGKKTNLYADFESWTNSFPLGLKKDVGLAGKTLIIFWEPNFGYDNVIDGSHDDYIKQFSLDAQKYSYSVILVPFDEMNINEEAWGYGQNNNTPTKFIAAWKHVHELFANTSNVKFGIAYNSVSIPNVKGNLFSDYYPGGKYVDYVGVDGFSFSNSWVSFSNIFDKAIYNLNSYNKPIIIFSLAAEASPLKASWIVEGLGSDINNYKNVIGWIWFNKGGTPNWQVDSDGNSIRAFRSILL